MGNKEFQNTICNVNKEGKVEINSCRFIFDGENTIGELTSEHSKVVRSRSKKTIDRVIFADSSVLKKAIDNLEKEHKTTINSQGNFYSEEHISDTNDDSYGYRNQTEMERPFYCELKLENDKLQPFNFRWSPPLPPSSPKPDSIISEPSTQ